MSQISPIEIAPANVLIPEHMADWRLASHWFAVYTTPRHEKRVDQHFGVRGIERYLPLYQVQRKWADGSRVTLNLPLFPGYIFVRIERAQRVSVLEVPGVLAIVGGTGGTPAPLPLADIEALRFGLHLRRAEPHPLLQIGQRAPHSLRRPGRNGRRGGAQEKRLPRGSHLGRHYAKHCRGS